MSYSSVDELQSFLTTSVFNNRSDAKKAAGRALGTLVEIITYYLLDAWGYRNYIFIEKKIPEYGIPYLTHNVEFVFQPVLKFRKVCLSGAFEKLPFTFTKIKSKEIVISEEDNFELNEYLSSLSNYQVAGNQLISSGYSLENCCLLGSDGDRNLIGNVEKSDAGLLLELVEQAQMPFAMFECKRVGIEEGMKKGPQTIEKAKQGAYVASKVSSLQKVMGKDGDYLGFLDADKYEAKPYYEFLGEIINSREKTEGFVFTVGVISNHGNWFTADNKNKEMEVLVNAYDYLIFLSDAGLTSFIQDFLLQNDTVKTAFFKACEKGSKSRFTKKAIDVKAHFEIKEYFRNNLSLIESWFNVIGPAKGSIADLKSVLLKLCDKYGGIA